MQDCVKIAGSWKRSGHNKAVYVASYSWIMDIHGYDAYPWKWVRPRGHVTPISWAKFHHCEVPIHGSPITPMDMMNIHGIGFICSLLMLSFYLLPLWVPRLLLPTLPTISLPLLAIQWPALSRRCRLASLATSLVLWPR